VQLVGSNFPSLAVYLAFGYGRVSFFVDQHEAEGIVPLHTEDIVDHRVNELFFFADPKAPASRPDRLGFDLIES